MKLNRLHTFGLHALKGLIEIGLALCGWPWWPWASRLIDRLDVRLQSGGNR